MIKASHHNHKRLLFATEEINCDSTKGDVYTLDPWITTLKLCDELLYS